MEVIDAINNRQLSEIAEIHNLYFPTYVDAGAPFDVSYNAVNLSTATQLMFGYIVDVDTQLEIPGSYWQEDVTAGGLHAESTQMAITQFFSGEVLIGHITAPVCETYTDATECINAGCEWYDGACHSPAPPQCSDYPNQTDCELNNCFWYNGSCHDAAPTCEILTNATECINAGCEWYDGSCHTPSGPTCEERIDPTDCINAGCFWYNDACHSTEEAGLPAWVIPAAIAGVGVVVVIAIVSVKKPVGKRA